MQPQTYHYKSELTPVTFNLTEKEEKRRKEEEKLNSHIESLTEFKKSPENITFKTDLVANYTNRGSFERVAVFKKKEGKFQLAFSIKNSNEISIYNLISNQIITKIKAHLDGIHRIKYYFDIFRNRELLLSSSYDRSVKIWNISDNYSNILVIPNCNNGKWPTPLCLISEPSSIFVVTGNSNEKMKYYNETGEIISNINCNYEKNLLTETYYYEGHPYLIICGCPGLILFDWQSKKVLKKFIAKNDDEENEHKSFVIKNVENDTELIEGDLRGKIRIWSLFGGNLKKTIINKGFGSGVYSMSLWNNEFLVIGCLQRLKIIDVEKGKEIKEIGKHYDCIWTIKKIELPEKGECLISEDDYKIKMWEIKE